MRSRLTAGILVASSSNTGRIRVCEFDKNRTPLRDLKRNAQVIFKHGRKVKAILEPPADYFMTRLALHDMAKFAVPMTKATRLSYCKPELSRIATNEALKTVKFYRKAKKLASWDDFLNSPRLVII